MKTRFDAQGLFWHDTLFPKKKKEGHGKRSVSRVPPPIPDIGWKPPKDFPDLSAAKYISIDTETKDPHLKSDGPGFVRGESHVVGISVAVPEGRSWYFPTKHEYGEINFDHDKVMLWARDQLSRSHQPKLGAHLLYDLEALEYEKVKVVGPFYDVLNAEPLLDENKVGQYSLNALAKHHLGETKAEDELYKWSSRAYGGRPTRNDQGGNIYRCPAEIVGPYAESDTLLPIRIFKKQAKLLKKDNLWDLFLMESKLIPMLLAMRLRGVKVDLEKAERLNDTITIEKATLQNQLDTLVGFHVEINAGRSIGRAFDKFNLPYPLTPKSKEPSFTAPFLKHHAHEIPQFVHQIRKLAKLQSTFVQGYVLNSHVNGRVHSQFHQLKGDEKGTIARFSSSNPNLQNIPKKTDIKNLMRGIFIPEDGETWNKNDYSQIEYKFLVHYARGASAEEARAKYLNDPNTDYHKMVQDFLKVYIPNISREDTKAVNFGLVYGLGIQKLAKSLGVSVQEAKDLKKQIQEASPFAPELFDEVSDVASNRGYIRTIMNRRARFPLWEPVKTPKEWKQNIQHTPYKKSRALIEYPDRALQRAKTYAALNRLLQGSAADMMKKGMVDIWEAGICDVLGAPLNTVHDELNWSQPTGKIAEEAMKESILLMEKAIPLSIPVTCDREIGLNWGEIQDAKYYQL